MVRFGKSRRSVLLLLPLLIGFVFQATQYARAPVDYDFYVVYAKNADIALQPGVDLSPNGAFLLQNSSGQEGLYSLSLGRWGSGYRVNYTDAFRVVNREVFDIHMIGFNFSAASTGVEYLRVWVQNDTDDDGVGDVWLLAWDGSSGLLSVDSHVHVAAAGAYGNDGGVARVCVEVSFPDSGLGLSGGVPVLTYSGRVYLWFTSASF